MKAVFNKLLSGEDPEHPAKVGKEDKYKFKHGLQQSNALNYKTHHPQTKKILHEY